MTDDVDEGCCSPEDCDLSEDADVEEELLVSGLNCCSLRDEVEEEEVSLDEHC